VTNWLFTVVGQDDSAVAGHAGGVGGCDGAGTSSSSHQASSRRSSDLSFEMLFKMVPDDSLEGRDVRLKKLTARMTDLERKYDELGRKENSSWEEMTDLYEELKRIMQVQGLEHEEEFQNGLAIIKQKVLRIAQKKKEQRLPLSVARRR
jgi:hypothetical protein